jgi:hypothetical protein
MCCVAKTFGLGERFVVRPHSTPREVEGDGGEASNPEPFRQVREEAPILETLESVANDDCRTVSALPGRQHVATEWSTIGTDQLERDRSGSSHGPFFDLLGDPQYISRAAEIEGIPDLGVTIRPSATALAAAGRVIANRRPTLAQAWADWIGSRPSANGREPGTIYRQLSLIIATLGELTGPLRHDANDLWLNVSEWYGRFAAVRGLATGEIVEEFQHLRELLILELSELIATLPARQSMATVLRLNRFLDRGIAHAVVGYTDSLFETLLNRRGVPVSATGPTESDAERRLEQLEQELESLRIRGATVGRGSPLS